MGQIQEPLDKTNHILLKILHSNVKGNTGPSIILKTKKNYASKF